MNNVVKGRVKEGFFIQHYRRSGAQRHALAATIGEMFPIERTKNNSKRWEEHEEVCDGSRIPNVERAALHRVVINCVYKSFERELYLHAIGMKNGRAHVLAWQIGGKSRRPIPAAGDWRAIPVAHDERHRAPRTGGRP